MNTKMLNHLLDPTFAHYRSIGELSRVLQYLLASAHPYRRQERWGSTGPTETLCNYGGCTNCSDQVWHSGRISSTSGHHDLTTWQQNHDAIYGCIFSSLCNDSALDQRWRKEHGISLYMPLKFPMAYQHQDREKAAWEKFIALHRHVLAVPTLNSCHKKVNVLAAPELIIGRESITLNICVTDKQELRGGPAYSRWRFCFLTEEPAPKWNPHRETFAAFILRGSDFFKNYRKTPKRRTCS